MLTRASHACVRQLWQALLRRTSNARMTGRRQSLWNRPRISAAGAWAVVEALEPHLLLSTVTWTNPDGGDWNTASYWSTGSVPGSGDTAVISGLNSGESVNYDSGTSSTVASVEASSPLQITSGSLTVTGAVDVTGTTLTVGGGTLEFGSSASLSVSSGGQVDLNSGELTVDGTLNITNLDFGGGTLGGSGSVSLSGTNTWSGGTDDASLLTVDSGATLDDTGGGVAVGLDDSSAVALDNLGTITLDGGAISLDNSAVINNETGGVFEVENSSDVDGTGSASFNNDGELESEADAYYWNNIGVPLANESSGTVIAESGDGSGLGELQLSEGGSNSNTSGTAFTADGGIVEFNYVTPDGPPPPGDGVFTFDGDATLSATDGGTIENYQGSVTFTGNADITATGIGSTVQVFYGGTCTFDTDSTLSASSGGQIDLEGGELTTDGTLSIQGLNFTLGTIDGSGSISTSGTSNSWSGGTLQTPMSIASGASIEITGGGATGGGPTISTTITNAGTINVVAGSGPEGNDLEIGSDEPGAEISGGTVYEPAGTELQVVEGQSATLDGVTVTGASDVDDSQGGSTLNVSGDLSFSDTLAVGDSATLDLANGATIDGGGTINVQQIHSFAEGEATSGSVVVASGGEATLAAGTTLAGGASFGSSTATGTLLNNGVIETSDEEVGAPGPNPRDYKGIKANYGGIVNGYGELIGSGAGAIQTDPLSRALVGGGMAISPTEIVFGWNGLPMNSGDTYSILESADGVTFTPIRTTLPAGNYFVAEGLVPNTNYYFEVKEQSSSGGSWIYDSDAVETNINVPSDYAAAYDGTSPAGPFGVSKDQSGFYQVGNVVNGSGGSVSSSSYNSNVIQAGSPEGALLQALDGYLQTGQDDGVLSLPYAFDLNGSMDFGLTGIQPICSCSPDFNWNLNPQGSGNSTPVTPNPCSDCGGDPIIYSTGDTRITDTDLTSDGFDDDGWSITRNWTAQDIFVPDSTFGNGWMNQSQTYLQQMGMGASNPNILLVQSAYDQTLFGYNATSGAYAPVSVSNDILTYNSSNDTYTWLDTTTGAESIYYGFSSWATNLQGKLQQSLDAYGNQTNLTYNTSGQLEKVTQSDPAGDTATFQYTYLTSGDNDGKVWLIEQYIQRAGDSDRTLVQQAAYSYYDTGDANGNLGDLKTVTIEDGDGNVLGEDYYRYYTPTDLADGANGFVGGLKYSFSADSFAKLAAAYSDPFAATDAQVAIYADQYYEYDSSRRVIEEVGGSMGESSSLGQGTFLYSYELDPNLSSANENFNTWAVRTTETLPDGNQNIVYTSINGDLVLEMANVSSDPGNPSNVGDNWITGRQYDDFGRLLDEISTSAIDLDASILGGATTVSGIKAALEPYADLGLSEGLVYANQGLINGTTYFSSNSATDSTAGGVTGFAEADYVQNGADGTPIDQDSYTYFSHSNFAGMTIYPVAVYTQYQSDSGGGSDPETTTYGYTWQSNSSGVTNQVEQETTTNPVVSTAENGSGTASSTYTLYNTFGQPVWTTDGNGYITYTAYDNVTGAVIQSIQDVQTSDLSDLANYSGTSFTDGYNEYGVPELPSPPPPPPATTPSWTTPSGAGLNYVTTNYVDGLGRTIEQISPAGNITLYVYDDINQATFTLPGVVLDTEDDTLTTTGPITMDRTAILYSYTQDEQTLEGLYDEALTFSVNSPISYTVESSEEPIVPSVPGFIQGDGASSGPVNVLNLIGDGSSSSPQFTIQSLTRDLYNSSGRTEGQLVESDAYASLSDATYLATAPGDPYSGTSINRSTGSGNYAPTLYAYDADGRLYQTIDADGTIDDVVYDSMDREVSEWIGTDDAVSGASGTPAYFVGSNSGTGNNMTETESYIYDNGGVGDGNLTEEIQYVDSSSSDNRVTLNLYDWRDRLIATKQGALLSSGSPDPSGETDGAHRLITYTTYDNLNEPTAVYTYAGDGVSLSDFATWTSSTDASDLRAYTSTSYDSLGQVYLTQTYSVNPTNGTIGASLSTNYFYDYDGNLLEESDPGGIVTKHEYNGAGQDIKESTTDGGAINGYALSWTDAADISDANDVVIEQTINKYDADGNLIETEDLQRFDSDPSTATGDLAGPSGGNLASRDYYMGYVYDPADRQTESVNVGTNGGSSWSWSDGIPTGSLITQTAYDAAGNPSVVTDPRGIMTKTVYDMLGRTIETIDAWDGTSTAAPTNDTNQTTTYTYDGDGNELTMTAVMPSGTNSQTTAYVYGTTSTSGVFSNDLLSTIEYPSASTGEASTASTDDQSYTYNKQGQEVTFTDQNGTTHTYGYDVLGRLTSDTATTLGSGVNGTTRRLGYTYNDAGLPFEQTSYFNTTGTNVENQVEDIYNGYGQLITQYQADAGSVNTSSTPSVQYGYNIQSDGENYSRQISLTYPDGRVVDYNYSGDLDNAISRLSGYSDPSGTNIESYSYLGLSQIVREIRPGSVMTLVMADGGSPGDAGDMYIGLDRFGRVVDEVWTTSDTPDGTSGDTLGTITEQFEYGYDQDGNVLYELNGVNANFSELFTYDDLNRLTSAERGTLNSTDTSITTANTLAGSSQSWDLDALGNQLSVTTGSTETSNTTNSKNELTENGSAGLTYDHDGNMTEDQAGNTYEYDAWNRLVFVNIPSQSTNENITYNAGSEQAGLTICNGTITSSYYSTNWQDLEDDIVTPAGPCTPASTTNSTYVWSEGYIDDLVERDSSVNGGSVTRIYAQQDANHDITSLVNSSGTVLERFVYEAYGTRTVLNASTWSTRPDGYSWVYGFQGGRLDPLDGLVSFRNRELDSATGTWIEQDPDGYADRSNLYEAFDSNPINMHDPSGLYPRGFQGPRPTDGSDPGPDQSPFLPDPSWKPEGWDPSWPTGTDNRGPYVQNPTTGEKWYPHNEDQGHWPHYDSDTGKRYPSNCKKPWPGQKRPPYGDQSSDNPWPKPPPSDGPNLSFSIDPKTGQRMLIIGGVTVASGLAAWGIVVGVGTLLSPVGF